MTLCTIELNDSEIRVARNANIILRSPGYAVVQRDKVELGESAARQAHLHPRAAYNRYWSNLNQDAIRYPSAQIRHNADLAYAHLLSLYEQAGKPDEVLFAVPGSYSNEQLSLLLGLVEASPFKALGLVDTAVAAVAPSAGPGEYTHLDMHLHQTILTHINVTNDVSRTATQVIDGIGLATVYDTCAFLMADLFIKQSRFDPQHHAETEQALYNQIPECLRVLSNSPEVLLEIQYQDTQHQAKLLRETLLEKLQEHYQKIINAIPAANICVISDRMASLPGFIEQKTEMTALDPASVFKACEEQLTHIRSSGPALNFITRLPATSQPLISSNADSTPTVKPEKTSSITHILCGHQAYPLMHGRVYLSAVGRTSESKQADSHCSVSQSNGLTSVQIESGLTVFLNGQQINHPAEAQTGDIISFAGSKTEYMFINVAD